MANQPPSVDELRARLRDLGYLDAGVDRFLLGSVRGGRGLARLAWSASLRIGALAGLFLGPSAALALGAKLPGLVTGPRDAAVLAAYLGLLFGVGVLLLAFVATVLAGSLVARLGSRALETRATALARGAAGVVGAACLAYLVLWWRALTPAGSVPLSASWTWPVLAVAVALSLFLGHAVMLTTLAIVAGRTERVSPALRLPSLSWRVTTALALLACVAAAGLLFLTTRGETTAVPAAASSMPSAVASPNGVRLVVVGVDGLDASFVERLRGSGRIPTLARLMAGARVTLPPSDAADPARTWTSLATGQPPAIHGVGGIETRHVSGLDGTVPSRVSRLGETIAAATDLVRLTRPGLTTALQRRSKTFWEVAAEHAVPALVVNWWATWPAPEGKAIVLSDRATLRLERGGPLDAEIAPASLYPALAREWPTLRDQARRLVLEVFPAQHDDLSAILRRAGEQDAVPVALTAHLAGRAPTLTAVYLPGLDIAQHDLLAGSASLPASALSARVEALESYYEFLDRLLGRLVDSESVVVALVADPGRTASGGTGLLALTGPGVRSANAGQSAAARADVAPTLLYLLGVPASRALPGRPLTAIVTEELAARLPLRWVESYGPRTIAPRPASAAPLDQEMLERLRSLGYVR